MDKNDIKKRLYKEKPIAELKFKYEEGYQYAAWVDSIKDTVFFFVPFSDMGTSIHRFKEEMPAHELIRWLEVE